MHACTTVVHALREPPAPTQPKRAKPSASYIHLGLHLTYLGLTLTQPKRAKPSSWRRVHTSCALAIFFARSASSVSTSGVPKLCDARCNMSPHVACGAAVQGPHLQSPQSHLQGPQSWVQGPGSAPPGVRSPGSRVRSRGPAECSLTVLLTPGTGLLAIGSRTGPQHGRRRCPHDGRPPK